MSELQSHRSATVIIPRPYGEVENTVGPRRIMLGLQCPADRTQIQTACTPGIGFYSHSISPVWHAHLSEYLVLGPCQWFAQRVRNLARRNLIITVSSVLEKNLLIGIALLHIYISRPPSRVTPVDHRSCPLQISSSSTSLYSPAIAAFCSSPTLTPIGGYLLLSTHP